MGIMKPINAYLTAFLKHTPGLILVLMLIGWYHGSQTPVSTDTPTRLTPAAQGTARGNRPSYPHPGCYSHHYPCSHDHRPYQHPGCTG